MTKSMTGGRLAPWLIVAVAAAAAVTANFLALSAATGHRGASGGLVVFATAGAFLIVFEATVWLRWLWTAAGLEVALATAVIAYGTAVRNGAGGYVLGRPRDVVVLLATAVFAAVAIAVLVTVVRLLRPR